MKAKIIAEMCQNHGGSKELLDKMIKSAAASGASYAKIQGLYSEELVFRKEFEKKYEDAKSEFFYRPFQHEKNRLEKLDLSPDVEKWFVEKCLEFELIPMITVFSHLGVSRARNAGFKAIKIASYDCGSLALIQRCAEFAQELVISTGATHWSEIQKTAEFLHKIANKASITFLHATTLYPTPPQEVNMKKLLLLKSLGFEIGFSDHTNIEAMDLLAAKTSLILGASLIERHFTILGKQDTRDGAVSLNQIELQRLSVIVERFNNFKKNEEFDELTMRQIATLLSFDLKTELSLEETRNRNYYKGRVASFLNNRQVYSWEDWSNE